MPEKTPELSDAMRKKHDENITSKNQVPKFLAIFIYIKIQLLVLTASFILA